MSALRATDTVMPTADDTVRHNPMRPPADSPRTAGQALKVFWRHPSPVLLAIMVVGVMVMRWRAGPLGRLDLVLAAGVLALFPINEWLIHVYMLHYRPRQFMGRTIDFYLPKTHRRHHADPWNLRWVFIPRHIHVIALAVVAVATWVAGPWRAPVLTMLSTYLLLGLHYEWVHYLTHITWCPPLAYYEQRVLEHRWHHFRNENYWWGVSMGLGDRIFRTAPDARETARSGTNRDLGMKR
jgi:hypothetical protein